MSAAALDPSEAAHDFRNVLLIIRGYSAVLRASLTDPQQLADVEEIDKAVERAAALTDRLVDYAAE